ncbi:MAG: gamma-glutamylcyclotransferase [Cyclobacteriaceae bacterium]
MEVFFYGLFMDQNLLSEKGIRTSNPRKGCLQNYGLRIGNRASLVKSENEKAYGIIMTVDRDEITELYSDYSVVDYHPEDVMIVAENEENKSAVCYNLPTSLISGTNKEYAKSLYILAKQLDLPTDYLNKIAAFTN